MSEAKPAGEVDQFIEAHIETVHHLEALLLIRRSRPKQWSVPEIAAALYVTEQHATAILRDLAFKALLREGDEKFGYN